MVQLVHDPDFYFRVHSRSHCTLTEVLKNALRSCEQGRTYKQQIYLTDQANDGAKRDVPFESPRSTHILSLLYWSPSR